MKKRSTLLALIMVIALVVTGVTYAYWANVINVKNADGQGETVNVAEGKDVNTEVSFNTSKSEGILVPVGMKEYSQTSGSAEIVESVEFTYVVAWNELAGGGYLETEEPTGKLTAKISDVKSNGEANELVNVNFEGTEAQEITVNISLDGTVTVKIVVTLDVPTLATYKSIANAEITFNVNFSVVANQLLN